MSGQAQAEHPVTALIEGIGEGAQGVGRIGQAVQEQDAADRLLDRQLETAVPVRAAATRLRGAAGTVADKGKFGPLSTRA